MLALAQGPTDVLITVAFITAAILLIVAADRVKDLHSRHRRPRAVARPTGLVRIIPPEDPTPPQRPTIFDFDIHA